MNILDGGLLTVTEASKLISISRSKMYQLMDSGRLQYVKIDTARRIAKSELIAFIQSNVVGGWNAG